MNNALPPEAQQVLAFWFGTPGDAEHGQFRDLWFVKREATDRDITQRFSGLIEQALRGELAGWTASPEGALAFIVLLDQFARNVFRDTPRAFAGDPLALAAAQALVASGLDGELPPTQRAFVYMPYEHAEDLDLQNEAVRLFTQLAAQAPAFDSMLDYAHQHRVIIQRFGRFPHRNAVLGRESSAQELAFLTEPGSRF